MRFGPAAWLEVRQQVQQPELLSGLELRDF